MRHFRKNAILVLLLSLPIVLFYIGYLFNHSKELHPTGFIQYDNVGYGAYAKQYADDTSNHLFYSNPFNDSPHYPKIYFQTQTILLGLLIKAGLSPGLSICLFSLFFCLLTIFIIIILYDELFPNSPFRNLSLLILVWGGGMLVFAGILVLPFRSSPGLGLLDRLFYMDPAWGWWGLNFGRPLLFGVESYYHFLFFSALLFIIKKKWFLVSILTLLLSFSHPFTGIHLLSVLLLWTVIEKFLFKNKSLPWWFLLVILILFGLHYYYYLIYLPSFADHKSVGEQYSANWNYRFYHFIPAYIIVFLLFISTIYIETFKRFIQKPYNRLFLSLAVASILLSNHELFMKPMQPIHFARGYEWTAYFLMGVPALHLLINRLNTKKIFLYAFLGIMLLDNFLWIFNYTRFTRSNASISQISDEQKNVLNTIRENSDEETLIIGGDETIPYLTTIYSKAYPWISHPYTTPYAAKKTLAYNNFIQNGKVDDKWLNRKLIIVFNKTDTNEMKRLRELSFNYKTLADGKTYKVIGSTISNSVNR